MSNDYKQERYRDAYTVAEGLISYGSLLKVVGIVLGILVSLASFAGANIHPAIVALGIIIGVFIGGSFYSLGIFIAANGQILSAVLDTAGNTSFLKNIRDLLSGKTMSQIEMGQQPGSQEGANSSERNLLQADQSSPDIKVYQKETEIEENAIVDDNQEDTNDTIPIRVKKADTQPSYEVTLKFQCLSCHKPYEIDRKSPNLVFRCIKCKKQMMIRNYSSMSSTR